MNSISSPASRTPKGLKSAKLAIEQTDSRGRRPKLTIKKIAIVLQVASTGGWRFAARLIEGFRQSHPEMQIDCYLGNQVFSVFASDEPHKFMLEQNVTTKDWVSAPPAAPKLTIRRILSAAKRRRASNAYANQLNSLNECDLVFFAWPYFMECPDLECPVVFLPHDFNYTHFMGSFNLRRNDYLAMAALHQGWMNKGYPVVSTNFIAKDLERNFPVTAHPPRVIHLARLSRLGRLDDERARQIVERLGIEGDYVLNVNNAAYHKNLGQILGGFHYATVKHRDLKLVICGYDTEGIRGRSNSSLYIDSCDENWNVISLGMRTDEEVAALIQCAKLVINGSLYEAGNGSGLDAWYIGTPVAMSNIPAFMEQMQVLGVKAQTFHPRCCFEIRDAILAILDNPAEAASDVSRSRAAMQAYDWGQVADKYLCFFEEIIERNAKKTI